MSTRPAYLRIADELRAEILSEAYAPGAKLPTAAELCRRHGVSNIVARRALHRLRDEGLVVTATGAGTRVRERPSIRRMAMDRYRAERDHRPDQEPATSFTRDQGIGWERYRLDKEFREIPADPRLARLFEVEEGAPVLERSFVFYADDEPAQMSRTCLLVSDAAGTPVADRANEPWPGGTPAQLATLGLTVTRVEESVRARMPTRAEAETLRLALGVPVFAVTRRMYAGARVVEVAADIIMPADRTALDYAIDLERGYRGDRRGS